jgi:hypothetical protein
MGCASDYTSECFAVSLPAVGISPSLSARARSPIADHGADPAEAGSRFLAEEIDRAFGLLEAGIGERYRKEAT